MFDLQQIKGAGLEEALRQMPARGERDARARTKARSSGKRARRDELGRSHSGQTNRTSRTTPCGPKRRPGPRKALREEGGARVVELAGERGADFGYGDDEAAGDSGSGCASTVRASIEGKA